MHSTDLTVAAIVRKGDRYLLVEEIAMGRQVINQPGGHIESGESPEAAVVREVLEETGCTVTVDELVGVYLWVHPQKRQQFLRIIFAATYVSCDEAQALDDSIIARRWMTRENLERHRDKLRTPVVLRCIKDYEGGHRPSDGLLTGMLPLQHNVDAVLERADLV